MLGTSEKWGGIGELFLTHTGGAGEGAILGSTRYGPLIMIIYYFARR